MKRFEAIQCISNLLTDEPVVVSLGHPAYDLFAAGDRPLNFYTWGSMGLTSSIALGLALARPDRRIIAVDGDGSLLMNLGSLATIGVCAPPNLFVVVMDNGEYGTTGGQKTATAGAADLGRRGTGDGHRQEQYRQGPGCAGSMAPREPRRSRPMAGGSQGGRIGADGKTAARLRLH